MPSESRSTLISETQPRVEVANALEVSELRFTYPGGEQALHGVNLSVAAGEKVALLGPNGAGKSTLLLHLNGILRGEGRVAVCGQVIGDANIKRIRALVGLVFEYPDDQLFSPTVFEDVCYGPLYMGLSSDEIAQRAHRALAMVGMQGFEERMPHHLSLGQRKRVAIATVLSMDAEILALDEPTASLSPGARRDLMGVMDELPQTMIVSTHDIPMVRELFPRTVILDGGRVVADGDTNVILSDASLLKEHGLEVF
ncbi:MAG: ATP-binding cassette domain-containing protein [Dehalococcoidia bacterium]|nr:ATP-binding cassette domain-containing protein [Dehalococcoidia bacterium]